MKVKNAKITGAARVGGLIGFIGGYKEADGETVHGLSGSVTINNCEFDGTVESLLNTGTYGTAGAIIGFVDKFESGKPFESKISNTKISGAVKGYNVGGIVGQVMGYKDNRSMVSI